MNKTFCAGVYRKCLDHNFVNLNRELEGDADKYIAFEMVKRCVWGTSKSDTRYPERLKKADGTVVSFYSFSNAKKANKKREIWIRACC